MLVSRATNKPLPEITDQTRPFWAAAKDGRLVLQTCTRCGTRQFHPKPWCIECGCRDIPWSDARPTGTVYSFTISRAVAMNLAGWQGDLPLVFCLIDLDDGVRLYAQVTDCAPDEIRIGMRVEAHFSAISEEAGLMRFRPAR